MLDALRLNGAEHVLGSILVPQAEIAEGFASIVVTRGDGSTVSGLMVGEDDSTIRLDVGEGVMGGRERIIAGGRIIVGNNWCNTNL